MRLIHKFCLLISLIGALATGKAEVTVRAYLEPTKVAVGQTARYVVEIEESSDQSMPEPESVTTLPLTEINGLSLRNGRISTGRQSRIMNYEQVFAVTQTLTVDVIPSAVGSYTIPGYALKYKGETLRVSPVTLNVVERSADAGPTIDELVFLKLDLPQSLYVGQTIQTELKLYLSSQVRLRNLNGFDKQADGFTSSQLPDDPEESSEILKGHRYRVITWPIQLTPIRSGKQKLEYQFTLTAQLPQKGQSSNHPRGMNSPFGSSIFDDFFGQSAERFTVFTDPIEIDVQQLPQSGKPASFSGAVGDFNLQVFADSDSTSVGEPIMLSLKLTGIGNFDRINGPPLQETSEWRHYKPESSFEAMDDTGMRGTKRFDYVFIPQKAGTLQLPEVNFSFFDPTTEEYVELSSPPISISVQPALHPQIAPVTSPTSNGKPVTNQETPRAQEVPVDPVAHLLTLDYQPTPAKSIDRNPLQSTWFWSLHGIIAGFGAIGFALWKRQKHYRNSPQYAQIQEAKSELKRARQTANQAIASQAAESFYLATQQMLRSRLTMQGGRNYQSANNAELIAAYTRLSTSKESLAVIQRLLETSNALRFSGQSTAIGTPAEWQNDLNALEHLFKKL